MSRLPDILAGRVTPGLYRFTSRAAPQRIEREVRHAGWEYFFVDGREIDDKADLLKAACAALGVPQGYGRNWDAFHEAVRDLSWSRPRDVGKGFILLYDDAGRFAKRHPESFGMFRSILADAVGEWQRQGVPMMVLLRGANATAGDLPVL